MDKVLKPRGQLNTGQEEFWGKKIKLFLCIFSAYISMLKMSLRLSKTVKKLKFLFC